MTDFVSKAIELGHILELDDDGEVNHFVVDSGYHNEQILKKDSGLLET